MVMPWKFLGCRKAMEAAAAEMYEGKEIVTLTLQNE